MKSGALEDLLPAWQTLPQDIRCRPASEQDLVRFEATHGAIPVPVRTFLQQFGGGAVGSEWLDGIDELSRSHAKFAAEAGAAGWSLQDSFVVGWSGAGDPIAVQLSSGAVVTEDHNSGGIRILAPSFGAFVRSQLEVAS